MKTTEYLNMSEASEEECIHEIKNGEEIKYHYNIDKYSIFIKNTHKRIEKKIAVSLINNLSLQTYPRQRCANFKIG